MINSYPKSSNYPVVFKQWSRKSYAVFNSLSRIIKIGVIGASYTLLVFTAKANPDKDSIPISLNYELEEVEVTASSDPLIYDNTARTIVQVTSEQIRQLPSQGLNDILEHSSNIDIRQRGPFGIQADANIRGGTFDQVSIFINSINITDPQTGHFSLNIPLDPKIIDRIEVLYGPAARIYGPNAHTGVIHIITKKSFNNFISMGQEGGSFGYTNTSMQAGVNYAETSHLVSASRSYSQGYMANTDFINSYLFLSNKFRFSNSIFEIISAYNQKEFGSSTFYSINFPYQFEDNRSILEAITYQYNKNIFSLKSSLSFRQHRDRFELFREGDGYYKHVDSIWINPVIQDTVSWYTNHNYHVTNTENAKISLGLKSAYGNFSIGGEIRNEQILSTILGLPLGKPFRIKQMDNTLFTNQYKRTTANLYADYQYANSFIEISTGFLISYVSDFKKPEFFPGIDLAYKFLPNHNIVFSYNKSLRIPTFTDLFYKAGDTFGNVELKPEELHSFEAGIQSAFKSFKLTLTGFSNYTNNAIDWIYDSTVNTFNASNLLTLNTKGIELVSDLYFHKTILNPLLSELHITYQYLHLDLDTEYTNTYEYKYQLDQLKHKISFTGLSQISLFTLGLSAIYQDRYGSYIYKDKNGLIQQRKYTPFWLLNIKLSFQKEVYSMFMEINNVFDISYRDVGSIEQPGRWIRAGFHIRLESPSKNKSL